METVTELKSQLHAIELSANQLRQKLSDSQYEVKPSANGQPTFEIITADDWNFSRSGQRKSAQTAVVMKALGELHPNDMTRIGPFASNKEASTIRARIAGIARNYLKWGAGRTVETHVKSNYVYVKRLK